MSIRPMFGGEAAFISASIHFFRLDIHEFGREGERKVAEMMRRDRRRIIKSSMEELRCVWGEEKKGARKILLSVIVFF